MSLERLPVELLLAVAEQLPPAALPALARTATRLSPVALRVLYRDLFLAAPARTRPVLALLAARAPLARHVRTCHIALDGPVCGPLLARALRNLTELHSLHLSIDPALAWVLRDAACPALLRLSCTLPLDDHVARFLHTTPALRELELDSVPTLPAAPPPALPPAVLPHLQQFIGSSRAAALIVPGRPVERIYLHADLLPDDHVPLLARATAPVRVLAAMSDAAPAPLLQLLHRHLPHLAYLRVMSTQNLLQPPSSEFYEQVASVLAAFPDLNAFELSGIHWASQRKHDDAKRVWQSSPLSPGPLPADRLVFGTDIFLAY